MKLARLRLELKTLCGTVASWPSVGKPGKGHGESLVYMHLLGVLLEPRHPTPTAFMTYSSIMLPNLLLKDLLCLYALNSRSWEEVRERSRREHLQGSCFGVTS